MRVGTLGVRIAHADVCNGRLRARGDAGFAQGGVAHIWLSAPCAWGRWLAKGKIGFDAKGRLRARGDAGHRMFACRLRARGDAGIHADTVQCDVGSVRVGTLVEANAMLPSAPCAWGRWYRLSVTDDAWRSRLRVRGDAGSLVGEVSDGITIEIRNANAGGNCAFLFRHEKTGRRVDLGDRSERSCKS